MKKYAILIAVLILLLITLSPFCNALQNGYDLFQKALAKERGEGNLEEAISLYRKVIAETKDESLAAKAQLRIGICYEKLGMKEAQKAYQKVIDNYPSQKETVKVAKEKLSILIRAQTVIKKGDKEFRIRKVWDYARMGGRGNMGRPSLDGRYLLYGDMDSLNVCALEFAAKKMHFITKEAVLSASKDASPRKPIEFHWSGSIWSPDTKKVAYSWLKFKNVFALKDAWDEEGNFKDSIKELRITGFDGSNTRILYSDDDLAAVNPLDWSQDGRQILAEFTRKDKTRQLMMISVADGSLQALKTFDYPPRADGLRIGELFSPDGRYVVFDLKQENSSKRDIFLLSIEGSQEVVLVKHPADDFVLGWTPDGESLIFASDRTGTTSLWALRISGGKPQGEPFLIKKDVGAIWPKGFDRNGSFYYAFETMVSDVYIAKVDPEAHKILSKPEKADERFVGSTVYPDWSPDGKYLAYISYPETGHDMLASKSVLCIRSQENGKEREIYPELRYIWGTCWSPDGRFILVVGSEKKDREGFYKIDAKTGDCTPILHFNEEDIVGAPVWSQDGKKIFYLHKMPQQKQARIMVYDLLTTQESEIYRDNFHPRYIVGRNAFYVDDLKTSPDGQFLVFTARDMETLEYVLKIIPSSGGEAREAVRWKEGKIITTVDWIPDGKELLFAESRFQRGYKFEFWRISAEGGEPQKLGLSMDRVLWLSVHPDGQHIAFRAGQRIKEIYAMDNFLPLDQKQSKGGNR